MEIREVPEAGSGKAFRDTLKSWKNRGDEAVLETSAEDEARAEGEGMLAPGEPEPVIVSEDALDRLEDDMVSFDAAEEERETKRSRR